MIAPLRIGDCLVDSHILHDRKAGLEEAFFVQHNRDLQRRLQEKVARENTAELLRQESGIDDETTLGELVDLGITAETLAALSLVPLVQVAWADGRIQEAEREALLEAAGAAGIDAESDAFELLTGWLDEQPSPQMLEAWEEYVRALLTSCSDGSRDALRAVTLGRAESVAQAAGGVLGIGKIAASERAVLDRLAAVFAT